MHRALTPRSPRPPRLLLAALLPALAACATSSECPEGPVETPTTDTPSPRATSREAPATVAGPLRVAVTIDDLPAHGPLPPGETQLSVHTAILDVLDAHRVPAVYGFINAGKLERAPADRAVLELWRDRGHPLGNHTYSHADINKVGAAAFIAEIERNDAALAELVGDTPAARRSRRAFRYPYLRQGADAETLDTVRDYLLEHDYRLAEVTVDFGDWAYNPPYARCRQQGDDDAIADLRWSFIATGLAFLRWSDQTARALEERRVPHVLLLHSGGFDAVALDELLSAYERQGEVEWITLDEALADPLYQRDVRAPSEYGGTLLEQIIERDAPAPAPVPFMIQPLGLLENFCT
ncbi:MAG: polysaccharide deacetylase family protein [Myxococcales bacterium]|nr:polysaccharide deacetylase family protein [Myxococcales bacterium]MCB9756025.1 polysaccharide deacetylase family protein [Myxococcales bacterium]